MNKLDKEKEMDKLLKTFKTGIMIPKIHKI